MENIMKRPVCSPLCVHIQRKFDKMNLIFRNLWFYLWFICGNCIYHNLQLCRFIPSFRRNLLPRLSSAQKYYFSWICHVLFSPVYPYARLILKTQSVGHLSFITFLGDGSYGQKALPCTRRHTHTHTHTIYTFIV
jgi:hypothetical protein